MRTVNYYSNLIARFAVTMALSVGMSNALAATALNDQPLFSTTNVPGNVALTLSVEFPTAVGSAYGTGGPNPDTTYATTTEYLGYWDPNKCYDYHTETALTNHYFVPVGAAASHTCSGHWSGNFLNWALTQTIDPFRMALTGGYRSIDTTTLTVLEKAMATQSGAGTKDKKITGSTLVSGATPYNWSAFSIRINTQYNTFLFTNSNASIGTATYNYSTGVSTPATTEIPPVTDTTGTGLYRMYARVQVCASSALAESDCTAYPGGTLKPTGLIQANYDNLNFAAIGYLNDGNIMRDGGVLRAKMAPLGPTMPVPGAPDVVNPNPEWDGNTGIFIANPDPLDAAATGVSNSGVINYLNKFGITSPGYKTYDPVSELYYTAIRYFKNQGGVASYTSGLTTAMKDGFPVITTWNDPIQYACQANFIIGIGDTNTHADANLPGSTIRNTSVEPAIPPEVTADTTVNVETATNKLGNLEGLGNLGDVHPTWCCNYNSYYIAGLAYDSHTNDIRPDYTGNQTITTYWLDVLESGFQAHNQYWLAAKYGGFTVPTGYSEYGNTTALPTSEWDVNLDGDPDNYFRANNPGLMIANLKKAFNAILKLTKGSFSHFKIVTPDISSGNMSYGTSYTVAGWTGDVIGSSTSVASNGTVSSTLDWDAVNILENQNWDTGRFIATSNCTVTDAVQGLQTCTGVPFRLASLNATNTSNLVVSSPATQQTLLNFLRGDRSNAGSLGTKSFRDRTNILSDIVNSKVFPSGPPRANYTDAYNPGYSAFKAAYANRLQVAYVGANDGMLHAFNGTPTGGNEIFAYVPQAVFAGPTNTPVTNGLAELANVNYVHHYYVDSTPIVQDVNFGGGTSDWHSLLVGGLGKGGKAYYAIDVTNPGSLSSETSLASAVKWEFTDTHMGYSYGRPLMVKTKKYGWVVILTSGYNNDNGQGYFFIVNPSNGALLETIGTGVGSTTNDAGLAQPTAFVADSRDFTADAVYAGDLLGNVWRLDLTGTSGSYPAPTLLATLTSSAGLPQPVTVPPVVEFDPSTSKRFVFVGTGKLLADSDVSSSLGNTFYAINDGTQSAFFTNLTAPVAFPFTRSSMVNDNTAGGLSSALPNTATGWYIDLGFGSNGNAYRVNVNMLSGAGIIAFLANLPGGDACNPSGTSEIFALTYGTGQSVLSSNGVTVQSISQTGLGADITTYNSTPFSNPPTIVTCDTGGNCNTYNTNSSVVAGFKQLNWRELPNPN